MNEAGKLDVVIVGGGPGTVALRPDPEQFPRHDRPVHHELVLAVDTARTKPLQCQRN